MSRRSALAIFGAYLGAFVSVLGQTIIATALPDITADLGGFQLYSWIFTTYGLAVAVTMPLAGQMADVHDRARLLLVGVGFFGAGGILCATAGDLAWILAGRGLQGIGAAIMLVIAMVTVGDLVPPHNRARWHALTGASFAAGALLGPLLGGLLSEHGEWRMAFLVPLPICLLALLLAYPRLRGSPRHRGHQRSDYAGGLLLALTTSGALLALDSLANGDTATLTVAFLATAAVSGAGLFAHQRQTPAPVISPPVLLARPYVFANLGSFLVGSALFSAIMLLPIVWQGVLGGSTSGTGLVLLPMMLALFGGAVAAGSYVANRRSYRAILFSGPLVIAAAFAGLALVGTATPPPLFIAGSMLLGFGIGILFQPLLVVVQTAAPQRQLGTATSGTQFSRQLGGAVGVTLAGVFLNQGLSGAGHEALAAGPLEGLSNLNDQIAAQLADSSHLAFIALALLALLGIAAASGLANVSIDRPTG